MRTSLSRRELIVSVPGALLSAAVLGAAPAGAEEPVESVAGISQPPRWRGYPRQQIGLVRDVVTVAHFDEQKVRDLIDATPALVNAWWDWGFGDWESPLGAASHTGRRSIALLLLERGARIDIFAAAMLGMTDVVKAFVTARPGVQRLLGPHGIPLLAHAKAGGEEATETLAFLETLGDAGAGITVTPLADDRKPAYVGEYSVADASDARVNVTLSESGQLSIELNDELGYAISRRIHHLGNDEFFPAGVPSVRVRFAMAGEKARSLTIVDREPVLIANRV